MSDLEKGARNLLFNCAQLKPGERLLILCENPALGWYSSDVFDVIATLAESVGVTPTILPVEGPSNDPDAALSQAIAAHDCTLYFARLGDQGRFDCLPAGRRSVMCYIRDSDMLASAAGGLTYGATVALKSAINSILVQADHIEITCPLGTKFSGRASDANRIEKVDVSVRRFPLGVHMPICASLFSGRVALSEFLTPTGSKCYEPPDVPIEGTVFALVERGQITGFEGAPEQVAKIEAHYDNVASKFGIKRNNVHSWHAGIHAGLSYPQKAAANPDRWSNTVFINPRVLHFHTCGDYAPAEISWMIFDQTVRVDGIALWQNGRLQLDSFEDTRACIKAWPELVASFENPAQEIGL